MSFPDRPRCTSRPGGLRIELLERRDLLSVIPILETLAHQANLRTRASVQVGPAQTSESTAQPTPHEVARERFIAKLSGQYVTGPGRFTDQSLQALVLGTGGSNQALRMQMQLRFYMPTDPSQPTTGQAALFDKNVANTGSALILDLTAAPQAGSAGLPTSFTWTVDGSSGGLWTNAVGQGTLQVHYVRGGKLPRRANGAGRAYLVFQGAVNTTMVGNDLGAPGNRQSLVM
jgi:hypothetical protein